MFVPIAVISLVCLSLAQNGFALKCYKCDGKEDCERTVTCAAKDGVPAPDQCWIHRETTIINGTKVAIKDNRDCKYSYECVKASHCNEAAGDDVKCEAGCCNEDLCNHHGFIPPEPKYHKPSGSDLSCYSCSDLPKHYLQYDLPWPEDLPKCSSPANKTCGFSNLHPKLKQDRCITFKITEKIPNVGIQKMEFQTCSDIYYCARKNEMWKFLLKKHGMISPTAEASCCVGNLCIVGNGDYVTRPQTGLTCLTCLVVLVLYWMI